MLVGWVVLYLFCRCKDLISSILCWVKMSSALVGMAGPATAAAVCYVERSGHAMARMGGEGAMPKHRDGSNDRHQPTTS